MNTLSSMVAIGEILALLALCLSTSFGIAFMFLKIVVLLTTRANGGGFKPAGNASRRSLAAILLRSHHGSGRRVYNFRNPA
jgi:hypothetical protein